MAIRLDIHADPTCLWCLLGKIELDRALAARPGARALFELRWLPFLVDRNLPREGMNRRAWLEARLGSAAAADAALAQEARAAREARLAFDPSTRAHQPSTLDAHRLLHWAGLEGRQEAVLAGLLQAHFTAGKEGEALDIGTPEGLIAIARDAGLDGEMVARLLEGDADRAETLTRDAHARARGLRGIPTFILAETHVLEGVQPAALWLRVIDELTGTPEAGPEQADAPGPGDAGTETTTTDAPAAGPGMPPGPSDDNGGAGAKMNGAAYGKPRGTPGKGRRQ